MPLVLIAIGGALGAVSRHVLDSWVSQHALSAFPVGTFVVNVSGSFVLGLLSALALERGVLPVDIRLPVMVGFVGAYTTFSTLMLESWRLIESGSMLLALANLVASVLIGMAALFAGLALGRAMA